MVRKWLSPRALLWHGLLIVIVSACLYAAWWQVHRAMAGNLLSYFYAVEWPAFAVMAVVGWWQLIQEDPALVEARREERRRRGQANPVAFDHEVLRRELAAHPELIDVFPELARAFPELTAGGAGGAGSGAPAPARGSAGGEMVPAGAATSSDGNGAADRLRSYNDHLAALAAGGRRKTWRNPHGR